MKKQILLLVAILSLGTGVAQAGTPDKYQKRLQHLLDSINTTHIYPGTISVGEISRVDNTDKQFESDFLNSYLISAVSIRDRVLMPLQPITVDSMLNSPEFYSHKASILRKISSSDTRAYKSSVEIDNTVYPIYFLFRPEDPVGYFFSNPFTGLFYLDKRDYDRYKKNDK